MSINTSTLPRRMSIFCASNWGPRKDATSDLISLMNDSLRLESRSYICIERSSLSGNTDIATMRMVQICPESLTCLLKGRVPNILMVNHRFSNRNYAATAARSQISGSSARFLASFLLGVQASKLPEGASEAPFTAKSFSRNEVFLVVGPPTPPGLMMSSQILPARRGGRGEGARRILCALCVSAVN